MEKIFTKPESLKDVSFRYCPGCGHGIVHRLIAEVIDRLDIREKTIGIAPVGCAVFAYDYFNFDVIEAAHGRPPAVATGLKRVMPDRIIFSYQGDGDLAAIGIAEIIHAANRGENITVIFINNATYGMTGGQMAPTTLIGQKTTTTPMGRNPRIEGYPLRMAELLSTLDGPVFIARVAVDTPANIIKTRKCIRKAFENQISQRGFSFVEVLSACPTDWKMSPKDSVKWIKDEMMKVFPLGIFKDKTVLS
ncbi:MAG: thiamine pyrophosphate-dependent enzyme [Nitrospirota bacterium]